MIEERGEAGSFRKDPAPFGSGAIAMLVNFRSPCCGASTEDSTYNPLIGPDQEPVVGMANHDS